jgi:hypothetical protein
MDWVRWLYDLRPWRFVFCQMCCGRQCCTYVSCVVTDSAEIMSVVLWQTVLDICQLCCDTQCCTYVSCVVADSAGHMSVVLWHTVLHICQLFCDIQCCTYVSCVVTDSAALLSVTFTYIQSHTELFEYNFGLLVFMRLKEKNSFVGTLITIWVWPNSASR